MILSAAWALQLGLYAHLEASPVLAQLTGAPPRIYDRVPLDVTFPFLTISEARLREIVGLESAFEHDIRIRIYSRWQGRKEIREIIDAVHEALQDARFPVAGFRVAQSRFVFADILREREGETHVGIVRFRIVTEKIEAT